MVALNPTKPNRKLRRERKAKPIRRKVTPHAQASPSRPARQSALIQVRVPHDIAAELSEVSRRSGMPIEIVAAAGLKSFTETDYDDGFSQDGDLDKTGCRMRNAQYWASEVLRDPAMRATPATEASSSEQIASVTALCCGLIHRNAASILYAHRYPDLEDEHDGDLAEGLGGVLKAAFAFYSLSPVGKEVVADAIEIHLCATGHDRLIPATKGKTVRP